MKFHLNLSHLFTKNELFVKLLGKPFSSFFHKQLTMTIQGEVEELERLGDVVWNSDTKYIVFTEQSGK